MSKTQLLFNLIMFANAKRNFTAQDVAHEFNISVRTVHRYLIELSEMGVPLYTEPGRNGGYRMLDNRAMPPIIFNENETFAIFFAFQSLKYYKSLPFEIDIKSVSRKLYVGLPPDLRNKIDNLDSVLSFWNKRRSTPSPFIKEIIEAALENHILYMEYKSKYKNTNREIAPIGVYSYDGFWYLPAFDMLHNEIRIFRLDRILTLKNTKKKYNPEIKLENCLDNYVTQEANDPIRLYVELNREGIRQCNSQSWLESNVIIANEDYGYIDMKIDKSELEFVSKFFLQLGTAAKVIEPPEIIEAICRNVQDILLHYSYHSH
jgi:predicted DNA-binding transcriptional regulator YafY